MKASSRRRRSRYSEEFKQDAVTLTEKRPVKDVAEDLGIRPSLLSQWRKGRLALSQPNEESLSHKELIIVHKKLKEELKKCQIDHKETKKDYKNLNEKYNQIEKNYQTVRAINTVLKKSTAIFSQDQLKTDIS